MDKRQISPALKKHKHSIKVSEVLIFQTDPEKEGNAFISNTALLFLFKKRTL